jgi:hypothetical protein
VNSSSHRAILVIGHEEPTEATFEELERYDEVFVVARAVHDASERWVIDDDRDRASAGGRLKRTIGRLRARGVRAVGVVGDENAAAARADALALFPASADATFA